MAFVVVWQIIEQARRDAERAAEEAARPDPPIRRVAYPYNPMRGTPYSDPDA